MALPVGWPPRPASSAKSIRFYATGTATASFDDNAFLFADQASANPYLPTPFVPAGGETVAAAAGTLAKPGAMGGGGPRYELAAPPSHENPPATQQAEPHPMIWSRGIRVQNLGTGTLEISFDGVNVQGSVKASAEAVYLDRIEAGIAVRGSGGTPSFVIEAW